MKAYLPTLITTEIFYGPDIDVVLDGLQLPFAQASLKAIVMTDVLHHLPQPRQFFREATRCVLPGGSIILIEPWLSQWSHFIYTRFHHEPFEPTVTAWEFPSHGPLSGANGALPYILFARDREQFTQEFPMWHIKRITPMMPFRYLLSGGVSMRSLMPGFTFGLWRGIEQALQPWMNQLAMFALIVLHHTP